MDKWIKRPLSKEDKEYKAELLMVIRNHNMLKDFLGWLEDSDEFMVMDITEDKKYSANDDLDLEVVLKRYLEDTSDLANDIGYELKNSEEN